MNDDLRIHVANETELRAAHANVHDVWSHGLLLDAHIERRLQSSLHQEATWYVGTLSDRVVTGLGCHPIEFRLHGQLPRGAAIASVHTLAEFRGRGFAPRLIAHVEAHQRELGAQLAILFSDVDPAYYAKMGYRCCPAHYGDLMHRAEPAGAHATSRLWRFNPASAIAKMSKIFDSQFADRALVIARPTEYWQRLIARSPEDEFYWLIVEKEIVGYARLASDGTRFKLRDQAVLRGERPFREALYSQLVSLAARRQQSATRGWIADDPLAQEWFNIRPREKEITMLKPLDPAVQLDPSSLAAADWIQEIDHV